MPRKPIDVAGQRFGMLVANEYLGLGNWRCTCDCGNETIARSTALISGKRVSCGCTHAEALRRARVDRTGKRYGRLTAIRHVGKQNWLCRCDCGKEVVVDGRNLTCGHTKSCGCLKLERARERNTTHGCSKSRLYRIWKGMRKRCLNENEPAYKNYGGRGIKICDEWLDDYQAFRNWAMENGYDENAPYGECTIDRIDVNGNYEPGNCRFITLGEQSRNTRHCRQVEVVDSNNDVIATYGTVTEAVEQTGISKSSIYRTCTGRQKSTHGLRMRYKACVPAQEEGIVIG